MKTCQIRKTCCICQNEKHNLEFQSDRKGRTGIKSYCKTCTTIYHGIKQKLIPADEYIGKNYDFNTLTGDNNGTVFILYAQAYAKVTVDVAVQLIKQGAAHITSACTIRSFRNTKANSEKPSNALRQEVYNRDNGTCYYCNEKSASLDHVIPRCKGGLNTILNLVCACLDCNENKADMSLQQYLKFRKENPSIPKRIRNKKKSKLSVHNGKSFGAETSRSCKVCQKSSSESSFEKNVDLCSTCIRFRGALGKGWISFEKVKTLQVSKKKLKGAYYNVIGPNEKIHVFDKQMATHCLEKGLAEVVNSTTIRILFTEKQIKKLQPNLPSLKQMNLLSTLVKGPNVSIYDDSKSFSNTVQLDEAKEMVLKNTAIVTKKNRLLLTVESKKIPTLLSLKGGTLQKTEGLSIEALTDILSVFDNQGEYLGTIHRHQAIKFLSVGTASMLRKNRIVISDECKNTVIPLMLSLAEKKIQIKEPNGLIIGEIPYGLKSEVEHLVSIDLAAKDSEKIVTLRKPAVQLIQEFPKMTFLTVIKKRDSVSI